MDADSNGIRVKATYYLELALNGAASSQRYLQQMTDEPCQIFYGFDLHAIEGRTVTSNLSESLKDAGINHPVKLVTFPAWKNKLVIRIENLNDGKESASVDIRKVAMALWNEANLKHSRSIYEVEIEELSVSANMPVQEMNDRKIQWKTIDDDKIVPQASFDDSN